VSAFVDVTQMTITRQNRAAERILFRLGIRTSKTTSGDGTASGACARAMQRTIQGILESRVKGGTVL
jgi:hypothetical protein